MRPKHGVGLDGDRAAVALREFRQHANENVGLVPLHRCDEHLVLLGNGGIGVSAVEEDPLRAHAEEVFEELSVLVAARGESAGPVGAHGSMSVAETKAPSPAKKAMDNGSTVSFIQKDPV